MRIEEAVRLAKEMEDEQLTELHIVNGLHPTLPWRYYPRSLRELKAALPDVSLKAFTATEIHWFEKICGLSADEILDELIDAGLESLTGGGAEIFDWEVRQHIVDHDTHWEDWSRIHRLAHEQGPARPRARCSTATSRSRGTGSTTCCGCASCRTRPAASRSSSRCATSTTSSTRRTARSATGSRPAPRWPPAPRR